MTTFDESISIIVSSGRPSVILDTVAPNLSGGTVSFKREGVEAFDIYQYSSPLGTNKLAIYDGSIADDALSIQAGIVTLRGLILLRGTTVPTSSTSPGSVGAVAIDDDYVYFCGSTGSWKRAALSTF